MLAVHEAPPRPAARAEQGVRASFWSVPPGSAKPAIEIFKFRPTRGSQFSCAGKRQNREPQGEARSQITVIRAERKHKGWHLIQRHCLVATRPAGGFQRASKVGRRVKLCPPGRDGIAEYLTAKLPKPEGSLDSPTLLNLPESIEQFGRINVCNRARSDMWEYVGLKPGEEQRAVTGGQPVPLVGGPLTRNGLERIFAGNFCGSLARPLCNAGVNVPSKAAARIFTTCACIRKMG